MTKLLGYVRTIGQKIKISINVDAFNDAEVYHTSTGESYVSMFINVGSLQRVISGERAVTTVCQEVEGSEEE
jgi:hypothetical protein